MPSWVRFIDAADSAARAFDERLFKGAGTLFKWGIVLDAGFVMFYLLSMSIHAAWRYLL